MPGDAIADPQLDGQCLGGGALATVSDDRRRDVAVAKQRKGTDEHVGALFSADATDPAEHESVRRDSDAATGLIARERIGRRGPGVGNALDHTARHALVGEPVDQRTGHGHDSGHAPEGADLKPLVQAVLAAAAREPVHSRSVGDAGAASHGPGQHVGPVAVGMHHLGAEPANDAAEGRPLGPVGPGGDHHGLDEHPGFGQRGDQRMVLASGVEDESGGDRMSAACLSGREKPDDALEPPDAPGSEGMKNHGPQYIMCLPASPEVRPLLHPGPTK